MRTLLLIASLVNFIAAIYVWYCARRNLKIARENLALLRQYAKERQQ